MKQQAPVSPFCQPAREPHQPFHAEMQIVRKPVLRGNLPTEQDTGDLALRNPVIQPVEHTERQDQPIDPIWRQGRGIGSGAPAHQHAPEPQCGLDAHLEQGVERQDDGEAFDPRRYQMQAQNDARTLEQEFTNLARRQSDKNGGERRVIRVSQTGRRFHQRNHARQYRGTPQGSTRVQRSAHTFEIATPSAG